MKAAIEKFLPYLRSVRNVSPHTLRNYAIDLEQFHTYLNPPDSPAAQVTQIDHRVIREYLGHLHDQQLQKSSMARKLAALRSFLKFCAREGMVRENAARLVATPKLPKRVPSILSAEEMNEFLDGLAAAETRGKAGKRRGLRTGRGFGAADAPARPRDSGAALRFGAARERADGAERRRHRPQGADAARAWQRQQGAHYSVWVEGGGGDQAILADPRRPAGASRKGRRGAGRLSQSRGPAHEPARRWSGW